MLLLLLPLPQMSGKALCTYNLHLLGCQLTRQVKQRGLTEQWLEHWYERHIGVLKAATKYRIHSHPEKVMANHWLLQQAIDAMPVSAQQPMQTIEQLQDMARAAAGAGTAAAAAARAAAWDNEPLSSSGVPLGRLEGAGKVVAVSDALWSEAADDVMAAIIANCGAAADMQQWKDVAEEGWSGCKVYQHFSAVVHSGVTVTSAGYTRSRTRDGSHVLVHLEYQGANRPFIATVQYFIRITHPDLPTQRVAVSNIYGYKTPNRDLGGTLFEFDLAEGYAWTDVPIMLHLIRMPCSKACRSVHGATKVSYCPFAFMSNK